jgi:hypothetical protein
MGSHFSHCDGQRVASAEQQLYQSNLEGLREADVSLVNRDPISFGRDRNIISPLKYGQSEASSGAF